MYLRCCIVVHLLIVTFSAAAQDTLWWKKAVIYEVTPYLFTAQGTYPDIEQKISELASLGINTLWLQPVFKTYAGGQGYDITDYFALREDLGTEAQLRSLITSAHRSGIKVMFDFVANHTSIHHPYALDRIAKQSASPYDQYYQSSDDHARYASQYHFTANNFVYYFWSDLVNLNYSNTSVRQWMIDACKYWIDKMDIDGYRFDAAWGFNARSPEFAKRLTSALHATKPSLLLLAEDKGAEPGPYDLGFNAAYDWASDTAWISHWAWEYDYTQDNSKTLFNHPSVPQRKKLLEDALFGGQQQGLRLRFLENNDMHRFVANHSPDVTRMAATLMFSLPGIPLICNGQETANASFPYTSGPLFQRNHSIASINPGWFAFYQQLIRIRREHPVLSETNLQEVAVTNGLGTVGFLRHGGDEDVLVVTNLDAVASRPALRISELLPLHGKGLSFTDLFTGDTLTARSSDGSSIALDMPAYATRLLLVNKNIQVPDERPATVRVIPNPTTGAFVLDYWSPSAGTLSCKLLNAQGSVVMIQHRAAAAGFNHLSFNIAPFPAGLHFLRIDDGTTQTTLRVLKLR